VKLTAQQTAFVNAVVKGKGHKCLRARAGTGKTSTIIAAAVDYIKVFPSHKVAICAFGNAIQT